MKDLYILGKGNTLSQCPWSKGEYWAPASILPFDKPLDLLFEFHAPLKPERIKLINKSRTPVMMKEVLGGIPLSLTFPLDKLHGRTYFTSTIAYMLAYAIYERLINIHLYGVDMLTSTEYAEQRPCIEYWIGYAEAKGVNITMPENTAIFSGQKLYGYKPPIPSIHDIKVPILNLALMNFLNKK